MTGGGHHPLKIIGPTKRRGVPYLYHKTPKRNRKGDRRYPEEDLGTVRF